MRFKRIPRYKQKLPRSLTQIERENREHHSFVIVGAGPVGLTLALDLARKKHHVVLLSQYDFIAGGSKAICFSKQSLDIFDRLGVGTKIVNKGVAWNTGKLFWKDSGKPVYQFNLLPDRNKKNPAFINLQQYYVEEYLVNELEKMKNVDLRWGHKVQSLEINDNIATLQICTDEEKYELTTEYVLACDGSKSTIRTELNLDFTGRTFEDNFLIADIKFKGKQAEDRPSERWFWFDPPFCKEGTALLHKQPDNIWRLDFQLGRHVDRETAILPEYVSPLVKGMLGNDVEFEKEWYSVYTFRCCRMEKFVEGPVIFVGDSAHLVSPFGARGANSGLADADNIAWKLDYVLRGVASRKLIETYNEERVPAADENILNSARATDFMSPRNQASLSFKNAVLELSANFEFARPFINSGRLSVPTPYKSSSLSTPEKYPWSPGPRPGDVCVDAPLGQNTESWILESLGNDFKILQFGNTRTEFELETITVPKDSSAASLYGAEDGATYLIRPDQVVAARWKYCTSQDVSLAYQKALKHD